MFLTLDSCLLQIFSTKLNNGKALHELRHGVDLSIFCQAPLCGSAGFVPVVLPVLLEFDAVLACLGEWKNQTAKPNLQKSHGNSQEIWPSVFPTQLPYYTFSDVLRIYYIVYIINYTLFMLIQSQSVSVHSNTTRSEALYKPSNPLPSSSQELHLPILSCSCLDSNLGTPGKQHETSRVRSGCQNTDLPQPFLIHEVIDAAIKSFSNRDISTHDHLSQ